jgi:hypothetical protein
MHLTELTRKYSKVSYLEAAKVRWEHDYEESSKQVYVYIYIYMYVLLVIVTSCKETVISNI